MASATTWECDVGGGKWVPYDQKTTALIEDAKRTGQAKVTYFRKGQQYTLLNNVPAGRGNRIVLGEAGCPNNGVYIFI